MDLVFWQLSSKGKNHIFFSFQRNEIPFSPLCHSVLHVFSHHDGAKKTWKSKAAVIQSPLPRTITLPSQTQ